MLLSAARPPADVDAGQEGQSVVFSLAVTTGLVLATMVAQAEAPRLVRAGWIVAYAGAYVSLGLLAARLVAGKLLAIALRMQAAALVVLAVPVAMSGSAVVLVWAGMAIAFGVAGARLNLFVSRVASIVTWFAAGTYLLVALSTDWMPPAREDVAFVLFGVEVPVYALLAWALSLVGLILAWLLSANPPPLSADEAEEEDWADDFLPRTPAVPDDLLRSARLVAAIAGGAWIVASIYALPPAAATVSLVLYAWLLTAADVLVPRLWLVVQALVVLLIAAAKWALVDLLAQRLGDGWTVTQLQYLPVLNPLTLLGSLIAGSVPAVYFLRRRRADAAIDRLGAKSSSVTATVGLSGGFLTFLAFGACLEIDRIIESASRPWPMAFSANRVRQLSFTSVWLLVAAALAGVVMRLAPDPADRRARLAPLSILPLLLAVKFLLIDALAMRLFDDGGGLVLLNAETATAALLLATFALYLWPLATRDIEGRRSRFAAGSLLLVGMLVLLAVGSFEVWRALEALNVSPLVRQAAMSIWWGLFAVVSVIVGLVWRVALVRYFGLALLAVTLVKVFLVDLEAVSAGWRTLSFIGVGLLLLATSVLYGKFSDKLLDRDGRSPPA